MKTHLCLDKISPDVRHAILALESTVKSSGLERTLLHLVRLRASQINGHVHCIDRHINNFLAECESKQRLHLLEAWREATCYSERERAALAWTEALTLIAEEQVPEEMHEEVRRHFTDDELAHLTLAVVAVNGWNRFAVAFHTQPGQHQPMHRRDPAMA
jgi:AhpD family alkylhydroperoxidase